MSKRQASGNPGTAPPKKRSHVVQSPSFGAENEYDNQAPSNSPSTALSVRQSRSGDVPSLVSISLRAFSKALLQLYENEESRERTRRQLKGLPDLLVTRVFSVLRKEIPTYLTHGLLVAHFIRGTEITLTGELPGVNNLTLHAIPDNCPDLVHLELRDLKKPSDDLLSSVISKLPALETLILRGCTQAGSKTVATAARCSELRVLNLNYTTPSASSIGALLIACPKLEVLKLANIPKLSSSAISSWAKEISSAEPSEEVPLRQLVSLKLRETGLNDSALASLLRLTPNLETLDVSYTQVRSLASLSSLTRLRKLLLTSCPINTTRMELEKLPVLTHLEIIQLGSIGTNGSLTLTDSALYALTDILEPLTRLENVSLVGNSKLGLTSKKGHGALADFVARVGRRCTMLNLGGVPNLSSQDLRGLLPDQEVTSDVNPTPTPRIESLTLTNTSVDNEAATYIAACPSLEALALGDTRFTSCVGLPQNNVLLGIHVTDRRRFFDVWKEARANQNAQPNAVAEGEGASRRRTRR
ncbi:hypothetical protein FRC01_006665 [Tulasnella sp. 417]|nr:hypothetical protein FRC01_006665 [Tulasnella sp. 417]